MLAPPPLVIGLVNIMPPAAMAATDRQFTRLLTAAAGPNEMTLRRFAAAGALPGYEPLHDVFDARLDGLIVTGTEPQAARMEDEPCWPALEKLVGWAGTHTFSTIWSCFSAHAAAFRLSGLPRTRFTRKLSGVFTCHKATEHRVTSAMPPHWPVPHSRYNFLEMNALIDAGYLILAESPAFGADSFMKQHHESLFLFLQGHPEYGRDNLFAEYRRDVKRFLHGQYADHPEIPAGCCNGPTLAALLELKARARHEPDAGILQALDGLPRPAHAPDWQAPATLLYAGWFSLILERKFAKNTVPA
jgi:homoserine O-succinyltransferase